MQNPQILHSFVAVSVGVFCGSAVMPFVESVEFLPTPPNTSALAFFFAVKLTTLPSDAHRKAVTKFQSTKDRVNVWMSPEGKEKLAAYAKTTPEKSTQKYLLRLIKNDSGIDCDSKEK